MLAAADENPDSKELELSKEVLAVAFLAVVVLVPSLRINSRSV